MLTWKNRRQAHSRLMIRSLVMALLLSAGAYEVHLESVLARWTWWLPPLGLVVMPGVVVWRLRRRGQQRLWAMPSLAEDEPSFAPVSRGQAHLLQSKRAEVIQTLTDRTEGRPDQAVWRKRPWYLLIGASDSGKTGLLEGLARLVPPLARPPAHPDHGTPDCHWWAFPQAVILDTCGRYTSSMPQTQDHDEWCWVLDGLRRQRARQRLKGVLCTVGADTLGLQPLELVRREAISVRQRLYETRMALGIEVPVYILVTRCDLLEGFVEFFAHLPEYARPQVFGSVHTARPPRGQQQHILAGTLPIAQISTMLTRRLEQFRLYLLTEAPRTGTTRRQIFAFPEEFRALQRPLGVYLEALCGPGVHAAPPFVRGLFFCSAQQRGLPFSALRHVLGFKTPIQSLEESAESYFLHDLLTVILPRDRHLTRSAAHRTCRASLARRKLLL